MPLKEVDANKPAQPTRKSKGGKENVETQSESPASKAPSRKRGAGSTGGNQDHNVATKLPKVDQDKCFSIEFDCDEIRYKIRDHVEHNGVKVTEFQKILNVAPSQYRSFMNQPEGSGSGLKNKTYAAAHQFFMQEETSDQDPKSTPTKKRKINPEADDTESKNDNGPPNPATLALLEGEETGSVRVYDTCNNIRTKIDAHLRKYKLTKVAFAEAISKCQAAGDTPVTPTQVTNFQRKSGVMAGNSKKAFYASYVYFEKLRIHNGKEKSKKRQEMEEVHGDKGVILDRDLQTLPFKLPMGRRIYIDKYGHPQTR